jgi:hypothetical protein
MEFTHRSPQELNWVQNNAELLQNNSIVNLKKINKILISALFNSDKN